MMITLEVNLQELPNIVEAFSVGQIYCNSSSPGTLPPRGNGGLLWLWLQTFFNQNSSQIWFEFKKWIDMLGHQDSKYLSSRLTVPKVCTLTGFSTNFPFLGSREPSWAASGEPCKAMADVGCGCQNKVMTHIYDELNLITCTCRNKRDQRARHMFNRSPRFSCGKNSGWNHLIVRAIPAK